MISLLFTKSLLLELEAMTDALDKANADIPQAKTITIFQCWSLPRKDAWIDTCAPCTEQPAKGSISTKAWFDKRQPDSLVSPKLAGALLAMDSHVEYIGIRYYVADHTVGISYLHIAKDLRYDIVISSGCSTKLSPTSAPAPSLPEYAEWQFVTKDGHHTEVSNIMEQNLLEPGAQTSSSPSSAMSVSLSDEKTIPCYATHHPAQVLELASRNGYLVTTQQDLKMFTFLLRLSCPHCQDASSQVRKSQLKIDSTTAKSDTELENMSSRDTVHSLDTSDQYQTDWDQASWSTVTSGEVLGATRGQNPTLQISQEQKPGHLNWLEIDVNSEYTETFSSSGFSSTESRFEGPDLCCSKIRDEDSSETTDQERDSLTEEINVIKPLNSSSSECCESSSEFLDHPGHVMWEWDLGRERWRRRGGHSEEDWYPDNFA